MTLVRPIEFRPPLSIAKNDNSRCAGDARIGRALEALAKAPEARWTVARLARIACLSRAAFARRFLAEVGMPPLRYLTSIRISLAADQLSTTDTTLSEVAALVGYANKFALSRAFRRHMGVPPGVFRRQARAATGSFAPRCLAA